MSTVRTVLGFMLVGAVVGAVVASFVVPPALSWYNETGETLPGKPIQTLCNIPEVIRYATHGLLKGQLIGAGIGAFLFAVVGSLFVRARRGADLPYQEPTHAGP